MGVTKVSRLWIVCEVIPRIAVFFINLTAAKGIAAANLRPCPFYRSCRTLLVVVFVFVNAVADAVLAPIQLALFRFGQMAVVLRHVRLFLLLDAGFAPLQICRLMRIQRTVVDPVGNAFLLVLFASVHFIHARMTRINDSRSGA